MKQLILRLSPELYNLIAKIANREDRSISAQIRVLLNKAVEQYKNEQNEN